MTTEAERLNSEADETKPPHSEQAERAVIGSILKNPRSISKVITELLPDDFYDQRNKLVYTAMVALFRRSVDIDYTTTTEELRRQDVYDRAGGLLYLSEIALDTPTSAHIGHYAKVVRDHSMRRRGVDAAQQIASIFYRRRDDIEDQMRQASAALHNVTGREAGRKLLYPEEWVGRYMDRLTNINEDGALGISTGLVDVDKITLGLRPGLWLVAARPGMGKSEFAEQIALNVATGTVASGGGKAGKGWSLFVSIEMTEEELAERAASQWGQINKDRLIHGHMNDQEAMRFVDALNTLSESRLALAIESGVTSQDIRAMALQLVAERGPLDAIYVDYVQLLKDKAGQHSSRADDVGVAANSLKQLSRELDCTVIACAQLNRAVEERKPSIPILSDLRDSGELEQAADLVLMLYRDEIYNRDSEKKGITDVICRKHRRYGKLAGREAQLLYVNRFLDLEVYRA